MQHSISHIFFIGIKGVAMTNLAIIAQQKNIRVSGYDTEEDFITIPLLKSHHISWITDKKVTSLPSDVDIVCYGSAHEGYENIFIQEAKKRSIAVITQANLLALFMDEYTNRVAVCGCHGKTTTTGLLAYLLSKLGKSPGYLVGVPDISGLAGGNAGQNDYFIAEADEYGVDVPRNKNAKFLSLHPNTIIATNIDFDHPDVYKNIEETKAVFATFFQNVFLKNSDTLLYACIDDKPLMEVIQKLPQEQIKTFGYGEKAHIRITIKKTDVLYTTFSISTNGIEKGIFEIQLFGKKQVGNAAGVIAYVLDQGFSVEDIQKHIGTFTGTKRRFELVAQKDTIYLFDDYAHHPHEITATIEAARMRFPEYFVGVIFQPHTYSRTISFETEFIISLQNADAVLLAPIFASAREQISDTSITSADIIQKAKDMGLHQFQFFHSKEQLQSWCKKLPKEKVVLFTMGAGDVYHLKNDIISAII